MNKIGRLNYLSNYEESLIVAASDIEYDHGIPLDIHARLENFQSVFKSVK